jgi:5'-AMP-activated protein kinase regulatory gamma subunit
VTCSPKDSLSAVFSLIKIRRVHRLVVVAGQDDPQPGRLVGVISLSDIMRALIVSQDSPPLCTYVPRLTGEECGKRQNAR